MTTLNETLVKINARVEILNQQISTIDQGDKIVHINIILYANVGFL